MARRKKNRRDNLRFGSTRSRKQEKRVQMLRLLTRWGVLIGLCCLALAFLVGAWFGLRALLFTGNDHFQVRKIEIVIYGDRGSVSSEVIREKLRELGVIEKNVNLFDIDLPEIRSALLKSQVSLSRVLVKRKLPDTLRVEVRQRDPVAQLYYRKGLLLDRSGLIPPESNNRTT